MMLLGFAASPITFILGSLLIWAAHFFLAYGVNALVCERRWPTALPGVEPMVLGAAAGALLLLFILGAHAWRRRDEQAGTAAHFLMRLAVGAALFSAMAVGWQSLTVLIIPSCPEGL